MLRKNNRKQEFHSPRRRLDDTSGGQKNTHEFTPSNATFRRSRTITGTKSAQFEGANEHRAQLKSPRSMTHALRHRQRHLGLWLMGALAAAGVTLVVLYQLIGQVFIEVRGDVSGDRQDYRQYIDTTETYLARHPAERLRFLFDTKGLTQFFGNHASQHEVEAVADVRAGGLGNAVVTVKMREPIASWLINGKKQYVDQNGVVFAKNYYKEPGVVIKDESPQSAREATGSKIVASQRMLQFVGRSVGLMQSRHDVAIKQVIIPAQTTRQVILVANDGQRMVMAIDRPVAEQVEDAARARTYFSSKGESPAYFDVRVSGKAFYR